MVNDIRFTSAAFKPLGIHQDAVAWTQSELSKLNEEINSPDIDNVLTLAQLLNAAQDSIVLATYRSKTDNMVYFSVPQVLANAEGILSIYLSTEVSFPLEYQAKGKTYNYGDVVFKVSPYKRENEKEVRAINLTTTISQTIDGFEEDFIISLQVKAKQDVDLAKLAKDILAGDSVGSDRITTIGSGSGGYDDSIKPWMLTRGFYKITQMKNPFNLPDGGTIYEGYVTAVDDSGDVLPDAAPKLVSMNAGPFVTQKSYVLVKSAQTADVYVSIDGAYNTSMGTASIGYASILRGKTDAKWKEFLAEAKAHQINVRRNNSKDLLSQSQIESETAKHLEAKAAKRAAKSGPANNIVPAPTKELAVAMPEVDDIPF
jgi:hypothetical protein